MGPRVEFDDGAILTISETVVNEISKHMAKKGFRLESGGILLGCQVDGELLFDLTAASMPSKFDVSRRYSFLRKMRPANKLIAATWDKTGGVVNYIGEWHTHDESLPIPSATDRKLMRQVVEDGSCLLDRAFMVIVGNAGQAFVGAVNPHDGNGIYSERHIKWGR